MEDIKTNFDKMMDQFNESVAHNAPKKLSFDNMNETLEDSASKKRRISNSFNDSVNNSTVGNMSLNTTATPPPSPWETRRIKADLIESKSLIVKLKQEIERQHKVYSEMETLNESKIRELTKQCEYSSNKVSELDRHLKFIRKREQSTIKEFTKVKGELTQKLLECDDQIQKLGLKNATLDENARMTKNNLEEQLSFFRNQSERLEGEIEIITDENDNLRYEVDKYREKAARCDELEADLEKEQNDLQEANSRIKELEFQISSYTDWKAITESAQNRLSRIPELEREVKRLTESNSTLHGALKHKLLLEEQVHDLRGRVDKCENAKVEAVALQVKLTNVEDELKEWLKVAQDHCLPNTIVSPQALRTRLEQLLQNEIILVDDKNTSLCEKKEVDSQLLDYKQKTEMYMKNIETLRSALKHHKNIVIRVQKKLLLVAKERDCYKQLLDNFEKDLTISQTVEVTNPEAQLRNRLDMLEKALAGYKEMCSTLEAELANTKTGTQEQTIDTALTTETYEYFKREMESLQIENERLRRRKEALELELEQKCVRGNYDPSLYKVVHFTKNPAAEAYENANNIVEKLQAEIERLKRRNEQLIDEQEQTTARLHETSNLTVNIKERNQLQAELDAVNAKMKKMKEVYKSASMEFREVCYMLFGYKVDRINLENYTVASSYAEGPDDYLKFRLTEAGTLDLLENDYSISWNSLVESQLIANKSLPVFLSTLTIELFNRTTMT